jgi:hypothetical protein
MDPVKAVGVEGPGMAIEFGGDGTLLMVARTVPLGGTGFEGEHAASNNKRRQPVIAAIFLFRFRYIQSRIMDCLI